MPQVWPLKAKRFRSVGNLPSYDRREVCTSHYHEQWRYRHGLNGHHLQYSSNWNSQWDPWQTSSEEKNLGSLQKDLCYNRRELRKKRFKPEGPEKYKEVNNNIKKSMKMAKENWTGEQYCETEENLRKNNRQYANFWPRRFLLLLLFRNNEGILLHKTIQKQK